MASNSTSQDDGPSLRTVSSAAIFNLPLYEHYLVIDTRPIEEYQAGHIATAVSFPSQKENNQEKIDNDRLYHFAREYVNEYCRPENANPVVIYGSRENELSLSHAKCLAESLCQLQIQRKSVTLYDPQQMNEDSFDPLETFCETVADKVKEIWIIEGGYESFLREYPFLCGNVQFEDMFPTPHLITPQLFLGSRVVPLTCDCLIKMNISHMIVSEYQKIDWKELDNIITLRCKVKDDSKENMIPCWEASCEFIDEAVINGGHVLVILHGRSRSASIILAYLIKKLGVDFEVSWKQLRDSCWHLIDRSLIYEMQLKEWERTHVYAIPDR